MGIPILLRRHIYIDDDKDSSLFRFDSSNLSESDEDPTTNYILLEAI